MSVDPSSLELRVRSLEERLDAALHQVVAHEDSLDEIRRLALKTLYGPDPEPSIKAMQTVLKLAEGP